MGLKDLSRNIVGMSMSQQYMSNIAGLGVKNLHKEGHGIRGLQAFGVERNAV
jgi:hypothetical protein